MVFKKSLSLSHLVVGCPIYKGFAGMRRCEWVSQRFTNLSHREDSCFEQRDSCSGEKVVGLSKKSYHFSKSRTTFI